MNITSNGICLHVADRGHGFEDLKRELLPRIPGAVLEVLPDIGHLSLLEAPKEIAHRLDTFAQEFQSRPDPRAGV